MVSTMSDGWNFEQVPTPPKEQGTEATRVSGILINVVRAP